MGKLFLSSIATIALALWYAPFQFRQSCWNADIVFRLRQHGKKGLCRSAFRLIWSVFLPIELQFATIRSLTRIIGTTKVRDDDSDLLEQREILVRASDAVSVGGRKEASGNVRDVQEACLRELYRCLLKKRIPDEVVRPLTRYYFASDALRDLFDYCYSLGRLYSRQAVANSVYPFAEALASRISSSVCDSAPRGRLPKAGSFMNEVTNDKPSLIRDGAARYWSVDHIRRVKLNEEEMDLVESEYEEFRQRIGVRKLRTMLCHEMAIQGLIEVSFVLSRRETAMDVQQSLRCARRIFQAAEALSYRWRLPD